MQSGVTSLVDRLLPMSCGNASSRCCHRHHRGAEGGCRTGRVDLECVSVDSFSLRAVKGGI
jgi:hypothetical protein